ncbi:MAG: hypothetical protein HKL96_01280 [Phycisphaerales bacterium]|nr:hypothetical protein [Phycisphaerales bacterium]
MQSRLPQWAADREPFRSIAEQVSAMVRQINANANTLGASGTAVTHLPGGTIVRSPTLAQGNRMAVVKLTAYEAGGGKYGGHIFTGNSAALAATNLSLPEGLADSGNNNALVLNLSEPGDAGSHLLPLNSFHIGLRVGRTSETANRAIVLIQAAAAPVFAVNITRDGGSDGSQTTAATWTYTLKTMDASVTLGTGIVLARPRPNGSMLTNSGFGLAFFDAANTLRLWDAGEVPATTACT